MPLIKCYGGVGKTCRQEHLLVLSVPTLPLSLGRVSAKIRIEHRPNPGCPSSVQIEIRSGPRDPAVSKVEIDEIDENDDRDGSFILENATMLPLGFAGFCWLMRHAMRGRTLKRANSNTT